MTPRIRFSLLAAAALLLPQACGGNRAPIDRARPALVLDVSPAPPRMGEATLGFGLSDEQRRPIAGARVRIEGTMSHAGMKPEFADATEVAPGRYEARLEFTMGGDWILLVDATTADGREHRWREDVRVSSRADED